MKRFTLGLILLFLSIALIACTKSETSTNNPQGETEKTEEAPPEIDTQQESFIRSYPLTGIGTNEEIQHRPFGVMIENSKAARPQSGLYQADLVYEVLSEATITRLLAFFHSEKPEKIGPVRSARDYYIHLNNGYDGIYVSAGFSPKAKQMIEQKKVDHINGLTFDGKFMWRSSDRKAPHNMYTSYDKLVSAAEQVKHPKTSTVPSLPYSDQSIVGEKGLKVNISYGSSDNNVEYQFLETEQRYIRSVGGVQNVDLETKVPVYIDNIFIVEMKHEVVDNQGRREIDIKSGGNGILVQNGVYKSVQWKNVDGQILPVGSQFIKGKTWINFVPSLDKNVSIQLD